MAVKLTSVQIELGLGGRMRDIFLDEVFTQGCWPLSELISTTFRDISGNGRHATLNGTGFTRGVATGLPEQHLALTFDGNGYLSVPDDGNGAMSLANGSMDIAFLIKTSHNTATQRTIIVKRNGSDTDGYYVGLVSGQIRFRLRRSSATVFDFNRGSVSDNAWHLIHCYYDPPSQEARIFIDGVQSGATVATAVTDPPNVTIALYIGGNDPAGVGSGFIGTLAYMDIGREGNLSLSVDLQAARTWTNVASDVRLNDGVRIHYGASGYLATDWVAASGSCSFLLDNALSNSAATVGYYSPGHASCRAGFTLGIPVRVSFTYGGTTRYKFQGRIVLIAPEAGPVGSVSRRSVRVTATDWFDVIARSRYIAAQTQIGQFSTDVLKYLIDFADQAPGNISIEAGTQVFGYALDQGREQDTILSEFSRIAASEMMYLFMRGNDTDGMTFVASTRFARTADTSLDATFTNTMSNLVVTMSVEGIINEVRAQCYPPVIDAAATSVLYSLTANSTVTHSIAAGASLTIDAPYSDPNDRPSSVGGTALVTPLDPNSPNFDYTANSAADGTGTNLTSSVTVEAEAGANTMRAIITNIGTSSLYLTKLQLRGKGIYRYQVTPAISRDEESIQKYGTASLQLDMPYQQSIPIAQNLADAVIEIYATPASRPVSVLLASNHDDTVMTQSLTREIGDHIGIVETVTGLAAGTGFFIHSVDMECRGLHDLRTSWNLIPPWPERLFVTYTGPTGNVVHDLDVEPIVLTTPGDYTFTFNRIGDTVSVKGSAGGGGGAAGSADAGGVLLAGGGGGAGGTVQLAGISHTLTGLTYTAKVGAGGNGGVSSRQAGTAGGTTEFRIPASTIVMQLPGGNGGGGSPNGTAAGAAGTSGGAGTGTGNVAGTAGGNAGSSLSNGDAAVNNANGAAGGGGGGGGAATQPGGNGGNGKDQSGGAGGAAATPGGTSSGGGGNGGGSNSGGGGGGGGGALIASATPRGGGGGGGAGAANVMIGGTGGQGELIITKV